MKYCQSMMLGALLGLMTASSAFAVSSEEQTERLQKVYAHLFDFRPGIAPTIEAESSWHASFELLPQPDVDNRVGDKEEEISPPPIVPRFRGRYHHSSGAFAGASWSPPIEVSGYRANMIWLEGGYQLGWGDWGFRFRGTYATGTSEGPITEKNEDDVSRRSSTTFDTSVGYEYKAWTPYFGLGTGILNTELDIKSDGALIKLENHNYGYGFVGVSYRFEKAPFVSKPLILTFEQNRTESFVSHFGLSATLLF